MPPILSKDSANRRQNKIKDILIFINIYGSPRYSKMRFTCSGVRLRDVFV